MIGSRSQILIALMLVAYLPEAFGQHSPASSAPSQEEAVQSQVVQVQDRLDRVANNVLEVKKTIDSLKQQGWLRDWIPFMAALLAAVVAIFSLRSNINMAERTLRERAREEERKAIREKIDQFYGPYELLRGKSEALYRQLFIPRRTEAEKRDYSDDQGRYRTVLALIRGWKFEGVDKVLLEEIVNIGQKTTELIQTKMGLVDDADLRSVLSTATAHYWVIYNLFHGNLPGGEEEFAKLVFPRDLDAKVAAKLESLNQRLVELQG